MSDYISNQDLLSLILKFLPVKTLIRFQSVCKSWKQLISSKSFTLDHLSLQNPCILAVDQVLTQNTDLERFHLFDPQTLPSFDILRTPARLRTLFRNLDCSLLSSVHGVICLYCDAGFILWNPSIRRSLPVTIPKSRNYNTFDALKSFWFDPPTNEFKIVLFCYIHETVSLFSSKKQEWIEVGGGEIGAKIVPLHESWQVEIDGVAHWIAYYKRMYPGDGVIVSFDFGRDQLGSVELPKDFVMGQNGTEVNIFKWRNSLSVVRYDIFSSDECVLWAMQNGSWSRMFSFKLPGRIFRVFCVLESRGRVLGFTNTGLLVLYDPKHGSTIVKSMFVDRGCSSFPYDFVDSLVFPDQKG